MVSAARKALNAPAFLVVMFILFWSIPVSSTLGTLQFWKFRGYRVDNLGWAQGVTKVLNIKVRKVGHNELYRGKVMYLLNHRSWADLIVDQYATAGRGAFLARWAVAFVFPAFMGSLIVLKSVFMFRRGHIRDKEQFNRWIDREMAKSPCPGIAVYPEGHRSTRPESLSLKRGMLRYAYSRSIPVQVVHGYNKESILSEKQFLARFGQTVAVGYSPVIDTATFDTFEEFLAVVQDTWDSLWKEVFSTDMEKLPLLDPGAPDLLPSPFYRFMAASLNLTTDFVFIIFSMVAYRCASWFYALLGPLGPIFAALLAIYVTTSLVVTAKPYDALRRRPFKSSLSKAPTAGANGEAAVAAAH